MRGQVDTHLGSHASVGGVQRLDAPFTSDSEVEGASGSMDARYRVEAKAKVGSSLAGRGAHQPSALRRLLSMGAVGGLLIAVGLFAGCVATALAETALWGYATPWG